MTLKDLVIEYMETHGLSQRQFANACGLSNGYISMIERGVNPSTGAKITPTLSTLQKLAVGMGMSLNDLFSKVDDMPVDIMLERQAASDYEDDPSLNIIKLAGRDGTFVERKLTDSQLALFKSMLDQLPPIDDENI